MRRLVVEPAFRRAGVERVVFGIVEIVERDDRRRVPALPEPIRQHIGGRRLTGAAGTREQHHARAAQDNLIRKVVEVCAVFLLRLRDGRPKIALYRPVDLFYTAFCHGRVSFSLLLPV